MIQTVIIENRLLYNKAILDKLTELVMKYPQLRFNQILIDCGILEMEEVLCEGERQQVIKDSFYEEPEITWNRMCKNRMCF